MTLRDQIVQEALTWRDTPYHHCAALKGVGCDCVGLLLGVARVIGCFPREYEVPHYSSEWHLHQNVELLRQALTALGCTSLPLEKGQPGDILTLQYGRVASHTAILVTRHPDTLVHAASDIGRVAHHRLDGRLLHRVRGCYTFPGVEGAL